MLAKRQEEPEDILGRLRFVPRRARIKKLSLSEFIRSLPTKQPISLGFVNWAFVVTFLSLAWALVPFYMVTGTFSSRKGVPLVFPDVRISRSAADDLRRGLPLKNQDGRILVHPGLSRIDELRIDGTGTFILNGQTTEARRALRDLCPGVEQRGMRRNVHLLLSLESQVSYQDAVALTEEILTLERTGRCSFYVMLVENDGP